MNQRDLWRKRFDDEMRGVIAFPTADVAPGATMNFFVRPHLRFWVVGVFFPKDLPEGFELLDFKLGLFSQFRDATPMHLDACRGAVVSFKGLALSPLGPNAQAEIVVRNAREREQRFWAELRGQVPPRSEKK